MRSDTMDLPHELNDLLADRRLERIDTGESGATVWRCTLPWRAAWYLKAGPVETQLGIEHEAACMRWLRERGVSVPRVLACLRWNDDEYLLTESAAGVPASADEWHANIEAVAVALGRGLAQLHSTDVTACPFDRRVERQLEDARARVAAGLVREDDFDAPRLGRNAAELFAELLTIAPPTTEQDLVLVHGDFCLPNVLLTQDDDRLHVTGLVDCGRAGVGDRHQDLALAVRSLTFNLGLDTVTPFMHAYGGPAVDPKRLEFYTILDEFF